MNLCNCQTNLNNKHKYRKVKPKGKLRVVIAKVQHLEIIVLGTSTLVILDPVQRLSIIGTLQNK